MIGSRLLESVTEHANRQPDAPALDCHNRIVSYVELLDLIDRWQGELAATGPEPGRPVAVTAVSGPEVIAAVLACHRLRLPTLLLSVELPDEITGELIRLAGCGLRLRPNDDGLAVERLTPVGPIPDGLDGITFLLTTSGSTGVPKIVPIHSSAVDRFTEWAGPRFGIGPGVSVFNYAPLNFDLSFLDVWTTLARGGRVVMTDRSQAANPQYLANRVATTAPQVIQAVPMFYHLMVAGRGVGEAPVDSVRHVLYSGDSAPARLLARLPEVFPRALIGNLYGCTEINDAFLFEMDPESGVLPAPVPLGEALPGVRWLIADVDGEPITGAGSGELWVHTPFQTRGYLNPRLNPARFVRRDGETWFRSGDLVRRDATGTLFLDGRSDFQVKVRGVQVNAQSVERALLEHPEITEAAVIAISDELVGHRLHAVVRTMTGARVNSLVVRRHCSTRLPRAAIPSTLTVVDYPLPRTISGKVDRNGVRRKILDGAQ